MCCPNSGTAAALIENIAIGWSASRPERAVSLVNLLGSWLEARTKITSSIQDTLSFLLFLENIRLKGMDRVPCLLITGEGSATERAIREWAHHVTSPGRIPFVFALSAGAFEAAREYLPRSRFLILSRGDLEVVIEGPTPSHSLSSLLIDRLPRRRLIAYNHLVAARSNMFFGREHELSRLRLEEDASFAVAGPGRIGKTSLAKRYQHLLYIEGVSGAARSFFIDMYHCQASDIARFIAVKIQASKWANRMTDEELPGFLKYQRKRLGGMIELILDEVDEVCCTQSFSLLGQAAKNEQCRLILCGRGNLFRLAKQDKSPLGFHLDLLPLGPLEVNAAQKLILRPLLDLGFYLPDPEKLVSDVLVLTGCQPHLIQFWGRRITDLAINSGIREISADFASELVWDFATSKYFLSALDGLCAEARLLALAILKCGRHEFTSSDLIKMTADLSLNLLPDQVRDISDDLVIGNVLSWNKGSFCLANTMLPHFASQMGALSDKAFSNLRQELLQSSD